MLRKPWIFVLAVVAISTLSNTYAAEKPYLKENQIMQKSDQNNAIGGTNNITITVTYDNNPYNEKLGTAWGFSCVITGTEKTILFDTGGDGGLLLENMSKLGIDPSSIEIVVLSHIHGDHTGGLETFLQKNANVAVYLLESFPKKFKEMASSYGAKIIEVDKHTEICKDVHSTGELGTLIKEQGLFVRTEKGLVIITGCAHPGIVKMTKTAKDLIDEDILLVMGGFHLEWATKGKVESIIKAFEGLNVKCVGPCHCTGDKARALFAKHFGPRFVNIGAGKIISIRDL